MSVTIGETTNPLDDLFGLLPEPDDSGTTITIA
jgi:hypothetical protein